MKRVTRAKEVQDDSVLCELVDLSDQFLPSRRRKPCRLHKPLSRLVLAVELNWRQVNRLHLLTKRVDEGFEGNDVSSRRDYSLCAGKEICAGLDYDWGSPHPYSVHHDIQSVRAIWKSLWNRGVDVVDTRCDRVVFKGAICEDLNIINVDVLDAEVVLNYNGVFKEIVNVVFVDVSSLNREFILEACSDYLGNLEGDARRRVQGARPHFKRLR